jgi:uncharacterized protein (PEP-CTERM system associated)
MRIVKGILCGRAKLKSLLLAGAACAAASGAVAAVKTRFSDDDAPLRFRSDYFGYTASVSLRAGYTDNINLAPSGLKEDAATLSTLFSGAAIYSTPRLTGIISGDLDLSYITEGSDFAVNQNIGAAATLTVADNLAYIDFAGSTTRQLLGDNARFSQNINAARQQRANVHTFSASPYLYREFADASNATLRYRFSQVLLGDDDAGANPFGDDLLNDSASHEILAGYSTGQSFERLRVALSAYGNKTVEDGSVIFPRFEYEQATGTVEGQFALTDVFGLSGAIGYDDINTESIVVFFNDDELSGLFWRAGFFARPGRRTDIRIEYGERFDNGFIDASLSYKLSDRITFSAGAGQSFESRAQYVNSTFIQSQRQTLAFADAIREGQELSPRDVVEAANRFAGSGYYGQTGGIGVNENAYAALNGIFDRTEVAIFGSYSDTDFGFRRNEYFTGGINVRRELSRRLAGYAGVFVRGAETTIDQAVCQTNPFLFGFDVTAPLFDPVAACLQFALNNGRTTTFGGRVGMAYRLYENLSLFGEYAHTQRVAADNNLLEYGENAVFAGVTLDF